MGRCVIKSEGQRSKPEIIQTQMWFGVIGRGKKSFNNHQCLEVVKNCLRFKIIPTSLIVVLNATLLHDSPTLDLTLDSTMNQHSPIRRASGPIGKNVAKAKRGST
ncbi:unnamed protein product [Prunus armeniaca]